MEAANTTASAVMPGARGRQGPSWLLGGVRFVTLAALALWLGGIIFLGAVAAPAVFRVARGHGVGELGPQMVGAMVARFNPLTFALGALLLAGWSSEHWLHATGRGWKRKLWWSQGACCAGMMVLALYLGVVLMPRLNTLQQRVPVPRDGKMVAGAIDSGAKSEFDRAHRNYTRLTMIVFWLGSGALLSLALRTAVPDGSRSPEDD